MNMALDESIEIITERGTRMKNIKPTVISCSVLIAVFILLSDCSEAKTLSPLDRSDGGYLSSTTREDTGSYKGEKYQVCRIAIAKGDTAKIAEVIDYCDKQLTKESDNGELYYIKAMAFSQLGDIDKAMDAVRSAVERGIAFERFLAGPRNLFGSLAGSNEFKDYAAGYDIELIHGPMLGDVTANSAKVWVRTAHEISVTVRYSKSWDMVGAVFSNPVKTDRDIDFTAVVNLTDLESNTVYYYQVVIDGSPISVGRTLRFRTTPAKGAPAKFQVAFGGGSNVIPRNEYMWDTILSYHPAAVFQLGDNTYYNIPDVTEHQQYFFYRRHSRPEYKRLIASAPVYAIWDDHDFGGNDSIGGADKLSPSWKHEIVLPQFMYNFNNPYYGGGNENPGCWFDFSIGDVDFFMLDGRYYRTDPQQPNPSMLGPIQLEWLLDKLKASSATFKIIASPVPWAFGSKAGSQKSTTFGRVPGAQDTWEGFPDEREKIFSFLEKHKIEGVYLISADRHRSDAWLIERPSGYDLYEANTSHLTKNSTHPQMPNAIFSILGKPAFGLLTMDTTLDDPQITYDVMKIDGAKSATLTVKLSQLKFTPSDVPDKQAKTFDSGTLTDKNTATPAPPVLARKPLDLYLLIGQSNMAGRGDVEQQDRQPHPRVLTLNKENQWVPAVDPIHFDKAVAGVGPGRTFGLMMAEHNPAATIGLIPCAVGGTSIRKWQPGGWDEKTKTHPYDDMLKRLRIARKSGLLKGILWHQGESDGAMGTKGTYETALTTVIDRLRTECADPNVPFVIGQLGQFAERPWSEGRSKVDQAQKETAKHVSQTGFVSSEGLTDRGDRTHFDAKSARLLGKQFAQKMIELQESKAPQVSQQ